MERDEGKGKRANPLGLLWRYKYVLLVAAVGALLLLWPEGEGALPLTQVQSVQRSEAAAEVTAADKSLEEEMETILAKIQGVGRVDVMLTVQSGRELVLAQDITLQYSGNTQAPDNYDRSSKTVTVSGSGSGDDVVVTQERCPQYRGALVVCDGGGSDAVRLKVVEAVAALTGLGTDRIAVVQWQSGTAGSGT